MIRLANSFVFKNLSSTRNTAVKRWLDGGLTQGGREALVRLAWSLLAHTAGCLWLRFVLPRKNRSRVLCTVLPQFSTIPAQVRGNCAPSLQCTQYSSTFRCQVAASCGAPDDSVACFSFFAITCSQLVRVRALRWRGCYPLKGRHVVCIWGLFVQFVTTECFIFRFIYFCFFLCTFALL
jgi:hypothetical protein